MTTTPAPTTLPTDVAYPWHDCRFLTCSVLPVRVACNLRCPFCFSRSSISALKQERRDWQSLDVERYYRFAHERGATRLVITGGGEPLLRPGVVVELVAAGRRTFDEVALFTNGTYLTPELAGRLANAGLSYVCYSRHAAEDDANRALMGESAPTLAAVLEATAAAALRIRATCVMTRGHVDSRAEVWRYIDALRPHGVREFTFKHTYVAYEGSVFRGTGEDAWASAHRVAFDPFVEGTVVGELPWGPRIRRLGDLQVCYYHEPTPRWERQHGICRSSNLLSDGAVYASLEDRSSLLFRLSDF